MFRCLYLWVVSFVSLLLAAWIERARRQSRIDFGSEPIVFFRTAFDELHSIESIEQVAQFEQCNACNYDGISYGCVLRTRSMLFAAMNNARHDHDYLDRIAMQRGQQFPQPAAATDKWIW